MSRLKTPVVFCTFNRYKSTIKVFSKIKQAKPQRLYLVSDAAREYKAGEAKEVSRIRGDIESSVDWECDLIKIYADHNMGCAKRISSALDYVFEREERAIILEDDCYPVDTFFEYCEILLEKYKDDDRIISIGGTKVIGCPVKEDTDYFFSRVFCCWGWATWRRAWKLFDYDMADFSNEIATKKKLIKDTLHNRSAYWAFMSRWRLLYSSERKYSWAYIFQYHSIINEKLTILPVFNLIENIGFGDGATNTSFSLDYYVSDTKELSFPLKEPKVVEKYDKYDRKYFRVTQKAGVIMRIKEILGLDINKSFFDKSIVNNKS